MATWNGAETLGYNTVKEYDHPTGVYKVSGIVRPFADENTQRNTFYVLLSYSCDGEDVNKKIEIPKRFVRRIPLKDAFVHDVA